MFNRVKAEVELAHTKDADLVQSRNIGHLMEELKALERFPVGLRKVVDRQLANTLQLSMNRTTSPKRAFIITQDSVVLGVRW
ncbi:hypothetical protein C8R45DRAFT_1092707 [Mycena sanguinolenta]|nr:hypothetical protein C8R45DRAFT_1092707 [Mycena sanguinolenta]